MAKLETYRGYPLWLYLPSLPAAAIFLGLFFICTLLHTIRMFTSKSWFCIAFTIGGVFEVIGYIARVISHEHTGELMPYAIQNILIILAPALFAASIYATLGRIILWADGEQYSPIRPQRITLVFVLGDVFSFIVQSSSSGLMFQKSTQHIGQYLIIAGLGIQVLMFGFFGLVAAVFHVRIARRPVKVGKVSWKRGLWMLYGVSACVMVRSIFRVVEYVMGNDGYLLRNEWTMYVFDASLMALVMVVFFVWYPKPARKGTVGVPYQAEAAEAGVYYAA